MRNTFPPVRRRLACSIVLVVVSILTAAPAPPGRAAPATKVDEAVAKAEKAIRFADERASEASAAAAEINSLSVFEAADGAALLDLQRLSEAVAAVVRDDTFGRVAAGKKELTDAKSALEKARDNLPADLTEEQKEQAKAAANAAVARVDEQTTRVNESEAGLKSALKGVYEDAKGLAVKLAKRVATLDAKKRDEAAPALIPVLARDLTAAADTVRLRAEFADAWESLAPPLKKLAPKIGLTDEEAKQQQKAVDDALVSVKTALDSVAQKLGPWAATINTHAEQQKTEAAKAETELLADPAQHAPKARQVQAASLQLSQQLARIVSGWDALGPRLEGADIPDFDFQIVTSGMQALETRGRELSRAAVRLETNLVGDFKDFIADQVSLYYFTDVPRLMQVLNPATYQVGGVAGLREQAEAARRSLEEAGLLLSEAQAEVNTHQDRLRRLREEQRQAEASLFAAEDLLLRSRRRLDELQARPNKDEALIARATQRRDDLQSQRDAENERVQGLRDEQKGLPAKIRDAERKLSEAQLKVSRERTDLLLLAQSESDAFARARDNTPFFYAPADGTSSDPSKRVLMYAFGDSKTLFLRGKEKDLGAVKTMIAMFDRPAPQSRMTLWSLELSSTADNKGTKKFNEALEIIESDMAGTRGRIAASLSFLRDCVNREVNDEARRQLTGVGNPDSNALRWARMNFYQREVLLRLGMNMDPAVLTRIRATGRGPVPGVTHFTLPDPASTTTLGEALMVLTLAKPQSRWRVMREFSDHLTGRLETLGVASRRETGVAQPYPRSSAQWFAISKRAMGIDSLPQDDFGLTAPQQEIIRAVTRAAVPRAMDQLRRSAERLERLEQGIAAAAGTEKLKLEAERDNIVDHEVMNILEWLWREHQILPPDALRGSGAGAAAVRDAVAAAERAVTTTLDPLRTATPRVAAADQMLKEIIIAFEDDLDYHFVQPMLSRLRVNLMKKGGIGVGVISRTSVLATNRLIARVDARGSAQLSVGEETDILGSIQQLAQIFLAGQTAPGPFGVLNGLNALPRRDPSELYGLTTNGTFQITPIFDPSGQALRFKLDQVFSNVVREPDGTVNPQLPRIERHTVNTEVQLSNLEIREVSRFNSNSRLGIAEKTSGGVPILKDIKYVRDIPLLGWFVKRKGSSAVTQQSLIFGQTTLYPTIGDIMGLLRSEDFTSLKGGDCPCPGEDERLVPPDDTQRPPQRPADRKRPPRREAATPMTPQQPD